MEKQMPLATKFRSFYVFISSFDFSQLKIIWDINGRIKD